MTFYDEIRDVASEVLKEFKQGTIALRRTTDTPDPSTPWIPGAPTTVSYDLDAVVRGVTKDRIDGTLILAGDLVVTCAVPAVVPDIADVIVIDGVDHVVKRVEPVPAAGTAAAYRLFVRK
jgi:hypothetical protein